MNKNMNTFCQWFTRLSLYQKIQEYSSILLQSFWTSSGDFIVCWKDWDYGIVPETYPHWNGVHFTFLPKNNYNSLNNQFNDNTDNYERVPPALGRWPLCKKIVTAPCQQLPLFCDMGVGLLWQRPVSNFQQQL